MRETYKAGATVASVSILGPGWMMSPPAAVASGVMNHPRTGPDSEIINRMSALRTLQLWCRGASVAAWGAGTWTPTLETLRGKEALSIIFRYQDGVASRGRNFQFVGNAQKHTTLITVKSRQLLLCATGFAEQT